MSSITGASIPDTLVTIQGQSVKTDLNGLATLNVSLPQNQTQVVATFEKSGFIGQAIEYDVTKLTAVSARLLDIKQTIVVPKIESAQKIESQYLGASITIGENSFAYADGRLAQGVVNVEFTPWDIQGDDLNAMPANGMAIDAQGNRAQLISAGMISATFKDINGEKLQLVSGKTADIQMNLPLKSINNQPMSVGTIIPMWHFDEVKGLWVEEGVGEVISASESSTGLAVHAKVKHFSTWNWDFKFENPGSAFVQCQSNGIGIPCNVKAEIMLTDGSKSTYTTALNKEGITVINMPNSGSVHWSAQDFFGTLIGERVSGTTGQVIIDLGKPSTDNFVQCSLPDNRKVSCFGTMNSKVNFNVSDQGSHVVSGLKLTDDQLKWNAESQLVFEDNTWVKYRGSLTSTASGEVNIRLDQREIVLKLDNLLNFKVKCTASDSIPLFIGKTCLIRIIPVTILNQELKDFTFEAKFGETITVALPAPYSSFSADNSGIISQIHVIATTQLQQPLLQDYRAYVVIESKPDTNSVLSLFLEPFFIEQPNPLN